MRNRGTERRGHEEKKRELYYIGFYEQNVHAEKRDTREKSERKETREMKFLFFGFFFTFFLALVFTRASLFLSGRVLRCCWGRYENLNLISFF